MLTRTASDATLLVDYGYLARFLVFVIRQNHSDCTCGAMFGAVATINIVRNYDAVALYPYSVANLNR